MEEILCGIDPALKNFQITLCHQTWHIDFENISNYTKYLGSLLNHIFSLVIKSECLLTILSETQMRCSPQNMAIENILYGVLSMLRLEFVVKIIVLKCRPKEKWSIAKTIFDWDYLKIKSKRQFNLRVKTNEKLLAFVSNWSVGFTSIVVGKMGIKTTRHSTDVFSLSKFDDYIDTLLLISGIELLRKSTKIEFLTLPTILNKENVVD